MKQIYQRFQNVIHANAQMSLDSSTHSPNVSFNQPLVSKYQSQRNQDSQIFGILKKVITPESVLAQCNIDENYQICAPVSQTPSHLGYKQIDCLPPFGKHRSLEAQRKNSDAKSTHLKWAERSRGQGKTQPYVAKNVAEQLTDRDAGDAHQRIQFNSSGNSPFLLKTCYPAGGTKNQMQGQQLQIHKMQHTQSPKATHNYFTR